MRVIAGEQRGRKLRVPRGHRVRPALARVKASLFDILVSRGHIQGERILDVFAGSGSLGIEALSRGAESMVFVEQDRVAVRALRANVAAGRFQAPTSVMVESAGPALLRLERSHACFDGAFLDPPYASSWAPRLLDYLGGTALIREDGWVAVHHRRGEEPAGSYGCLIAEISRRIGDAGLTIYWRRQ